MQHKCPQQQDPVNKVPIEAFASMDHGTMRRSVGHELSMKLEVHQEHRITLQGLSREENWRKGRQLQEHFKSEGRWQVQEHPKQQDGHRTEIK